MSAEPKDEKGSVQENFTSGDIPGFEDAAPIGPELSDFGRKEESLLAFENYPEIGTLLPAGDLELIHVSTIPLGFVPDADDRALDHEVRFCKGILDQGTPVGVGLSLPLGE